MADAIKQFTFNVPAGNGGQTVHQYDMSIGPSEVERMLIQFPPGCANLVNLAVSVGGSPIFPDQAGAYIHFDNYIYVIQVTTPHYNGDWSIGISNTDYVDHEIEVLIEYRYIQNANPFLARQPLSL